MFSTEPYKFLSIYDANLANFLNANNILRSLFCGTCLSRRDAGVYFRSIGSWEIYASRTMAFQNGGKKLQKIHGKFNLYRSAQLLSKHCKISSRPFLKRACRTAVREDGNEKRDTCILSFLKPLTTDLEVPYNRGEILRVRRSTEFKYSYC